MPKNNIKNNPDKDINNSTVGAVLSAIAGLAGGTGNAEPVIIEPVEETKPTGLYIAMALVLLSMVLGIYYATK